MKYKFGEHCCVKEKMNKMLSKFWTIVGFLILSLGFYSQSSYAGMVKYCFCHNYTQGPGGQTQCVDLSSVDDPNNSHGDHIKCNDCTIDPNSHPDCGNYVSCQPRDTRGKCTGCGNGLIDNEADCCNPNIEDCTGIENLCESCDDGNNQDGDGCSEDCQKECTGSPAGCDDGEECTEDSCDGETGFCQNLPKTQGSSCNDSNACTNQDVCQQDGACSGTAVVCSALDNCHEAGICDAETGQCSNPPKQDGSPCPDENLCNGNEVCEAGICVPGTPTICNDGNICTDDSECTPLNGSCSYTPNTNACDDGNVCTEGDVCSNSDCTPGVVKSCDDQNICTIDTCEPELNLLALDDPEAGCVHTDNNEASQPCYTGPDGTKDVGVCHSGEYQCENGELGGVCIGEVLPCDEICDGFDNDCDGQVDEPEGDPLCNDGQICTSDACTNGACVYSPTDLGTIECGVGACHVEMNKCEGGELQQCVPGEPCKEICNGIDDDCDGQIDEVDGQESLCPDNDGDPCVSYQCSSGACVPFDTDYQCDDGNACTVGDQCHEGVCKCGTEKSCSDNDNIECTVGVCNPQNGQCEVDNSTCACLKDSDCPDDQNACTDTVCQAGACVDVVDNTNSCSDGNYCTQDVCMNGCCESQFNSNLCECTSDSDCNDGNPCTEDRCDSNYDLFYNGKKVCVNDPNIGQACNDNDACTLGDVCNAQGICEAGAPKDCNDENPCTADRCNVDTGECQYTEDNSDARACGTPEGGGGNGGGSTCSLNLDASSLSPISAKVLLLGMAPVVSFVTTRRWRKSKESSAC